MHNNGFASSFFTMGFAGEVDEMMIPSSSSADDLF
jgi:hypothetical protein